MDTNMSVRAAVRSQVTALTSCFSLLGVLLQIFTDKKIQRLDFLNTAEEHDDYSEDKSKNTDSHSLFITSSKMHLRGQYLLPTWLHTR